MSVFNFDQLEYDTWYWMVNPEEGDIFYPVFYNEQGAIVIDAIGHAPHELMGLKFHKAILPL